LAVARTCGAEVVPAVGALVTQDLSGKWAAKAGLPREGGMKDGRFSFGPDRISKTLYDDAGRPLQSISALGVSGVESTEATVTYTSNGKVATATDAQGNKTSAAYDGLDRLIQNNFPSKTTPGTASSTDYRGYTYDTNGNRLTLRNRDGSTISYSYDALNRLSVKDLPGGTASDVYYAYDLTGALTAARFVSTSGVGLANTYDTLGRLTATTNNMGSSSLTVTLSYDPLGRLWQFTGPTDTLQYLFDGNDLASIYRPGTGMIQRTVFGPGSDAPLVTYIGSTLSICGRPE
jgi:YD repeat-containing protein